MLRAQTLSLLLGLAALRFAAAQSGFEGQIRGTVTDPAGALVIGADVRLTAVSTAITTEAKTNDKGTYTLNGLRPGRYNLVVQQPGFAEAETKDITLEVSQQAVINVTLHLASVS